MKNISILGFKVSPPEDLERADKADDFVDMRKPAIRLLEYNIRCSFHSLLCEGFAAFVSFSTWIIILRESFTLDLWFSLMLLFFIGCQALFFVVLFVISWKRREILKDALFLKRLTWTED